MLSVGLTGGIASGKSFAMSCFRKQGACLIDADAVSLDLVKPGKEGWKRIQKHFGEDVITENGTVDRVKLGKIIFSDDEKRDLLNHLLHPLIIDEIKMKLKQIDEKNPLSIVVVELPLLIECGLQNDFDKIVVVVTTRATQVRRLMERNSLSRKEADQRLNAQMDLYKKKEYADYIIENNATKEEVEKQVKEMYCLMKTEVKA
jgi:dephospho-CoA kinase